MKPTLRHQEVAALPKLAWLASLDLRNGTLEALHGSAVECRQDWLVEGVWDADFLQGNFHRSENFFGSGVRVENESVYFVPSSGLVDRILYCMHDELLLVSNSLVLLLSHTGARLSYDHDYLAESWASCSGIRSYKKELPVVHHAISTFYQLYHESLVVTHGRISFESKSGPRTIQSFEEYEELLTSALREIGRNYRDGSRTSSLTAFSTVSSGYDSVAVTCLARQLGIKSCFTSAPRSKWNLGYLVFRNFGRDEGRPIADALSLETIPLRTVRAANADPELELYFYAAASSIFELIFHEMAVHIRRNCNAAIVFTGYHGDKVWDVSTSGKFLDDDVKRSDISGLTLSEARLQSGFVNVAVPFILARSIGSIVDISRSRAMAPWRLGNSYDRPIPRRIAETAGIARDLFGMRKNAAMRDRSYPANRRLRKDFFDHTRKTYGLGRMAILFLEKANRTIFICEQGARWLFERAGLGRRGVAALNIPTRRLGKDMLLNRKLFVWAANSLSAATEAILPRSGFGLARERRR
jgi:hypothetical protein